LAKRAKRRIYLRTGKDSFAPIAWFESRGDKELAFGFRGLSSSTPEYAARFPDRELSTGDLLTAQHDYSEAEPVGVEADHFSFHSNGECHLARRRGIPHSDAVFGEPIDRTAQRFLDLMIFLDRADRYAAERAKPPLLSLRVSPDAYLRLRINAFGADAPAHEILQREVRNPAAVRGFALGPFAASVEWAVSPPLSPEVAAARPAGTFVLFRWLLGPNRHLVRGFVFR